MRSGLSVAAQVVLPMMLLGLMSGQAAAQVVAKVQGPNGSFEITAQRLEAYLATDPSRAPRVALEELIEFELLAAVAAQRGYTKAELHDDVAPVLVRRILQDEFEKQVAKGNLDRKYLERAYKQNKQLFVRPKLRGAEHILLTDNGTAPPPEVAAQAEALAKALAKSLVDEPVDNGEDFAKRAERFKAQAEAMGLILRYEDLSLFQRKGRFDRKFSEAAFAIDEPNTIVGPFDTKFGWHVVRITKVLPALNRSLADAEPELREKVLDDARKFELQKRTDILARELGVVVNEDPLVALEARRGLMPLEE